MSIINQALKKAQREQLLHTSQPLPGGKYHATTAPARLWLGLAVGFTVALGLGAVLHSWLTVPAGPGIDAATTATLMTQPVTAIPHPAAVPRPIAVHTDTVLQPPSPALVSLETHRPPPVAETQPVRVASVATPVSSATPPPARSLQEALREPIQQDRQQTQILFNRAIEAQEAGDLERARALLEETVQRDPSLKGAYNSLGNLYYQQQQYQQAIVMYERALQLDPDYAKARNNLGSTYLRLAMDDRAFTELHKALEADSTYGLAYYNLACVYARAGDSTTAAQYLQQAIALEPQARIWAQSDDDFGPVRGAPIIQKLLGL